MSKRIKSSLRYLFFSFTTFLLTTTTEIGAVGFHSSGSSSSSSSSSSGGGSLLGTIIIIIISIILYIIKTKVGRMNALEKQNRLREEKKLSLSEDFNFCDEILESQIQNNILDILYAINDGNRDELYIYCTEKFINNNRNISMLCNLDVDHIAWVTPNIESIYSDGNYDYIDLRVKFDIIDGTYTTEKIIGLKLKRADKVVSKGLNQSNTLNACKSCGAPMDYKKSYTCEYCGSQSRLSEQDTWLIDDLMPIII